MDGWMDGDAPVFPPPVLPACEHSAAAARKQNLPGIQSHFIPFTKDSDPGEMASQHPREQGAGSAASC